MHLVHKKKLPLHSPKFVFLVIWFLLLITFATLAVQRLVRQKHAWSHRWQHRVTEAIPINSSIYPDSIDESTPLSPNTNVEMPDYRNDPCIIMSVKGLPKTGTHWIETTLRVIKQMTCQSKEAKKSVFCLQSKVIVYEKHSLKSFGYNSQYMKQNKINGKQKRWCQIVPFRDPRNCILSFFMMKNIKFLHSRKQDRLFSELDKLYLINLIKNWMKQLKHGMCLQCPTME